MRGGHALLALLALFATGVGASGYTLLGSIWKVTPVIMHLELGSSGTLMDGEASWDAVAIGALYTWNYYLLGLQFMPVIDSAKPADGDGVNNVSFASTIYGTDFGDAVAVTTEWNDPTNSQVRKEADVIFNSNLNWNSYRGPLKAGVDGYVLYDFRRVALHEFGHVVGLGHPDTAGQSVEAVMNSRTSDIDDLRLDDVQGGQSLYGEKAPFAETIATINRPGRNIVTKSGNYLLLGSANPDTVKTVYLTNSRLGRKFYRASGVGDWRVDLPLKSGRNTVTLYIRGNDGIRRKIDRRVLTRLIN